ncbi:tRNA-dihydrouridine synthase [Halomicroarcula sp. GCM10025324]|uniref:tRNA-dihydrouridine synthase n=1 Tax=Haloarcula TaxID=2237 RepID=UPI0023E7D6E3|nr:tRNA-dihydrouridine synthase [Halomicroarcula sp. ZS-22-S1]
MFQPRVALASLSGEADATWARDGAEHAGCAFLGGISLDDATRAAARRLVDRDRSEFLPDDPMAFVDRQLAAIRDVPVRPAFNVRSTTTEATERAARVCADHGAILELNAHCRQDEMCAAGAGETILRDPDRLAAHVRTASRAGAPVSVKVRAEVDGVDLGSVAETIDTAGASAIHVDAMDSEAVVADVVDAASLFVIANNGVRGRATAREYLEFGADAVSVGRPSDDPDVLRAVREAVDDWFTQEVSR